MIDGVATKAGTRQKLESEILRFDEESRMRIGPQLEKSLAEAFAMMRDNVDLYLDWYYSLGAEYVRLFKSASGGLETHLVNKLEETLGNGDPFKNFEELLRMSMTLESEGADRLKQELSKIIMANRVDVASGQPVQISLSTTLDEIFNPALHRDLSSIEQRFISGGATGVISVLVARQVVGKLVARGTVRLAATSLARVGVSRGAATFGGASAGAASGALIGSIVPGFGTAAGAVVGGVVGALGIGFGAEFLILKAEEVIQRDAHKESILASINEMEVSLRQEISIIKTLSQPIEQPTLPTN